MNFPANNRLLVDAGWYLVIGEFLRWEVIGNADQVWCEQSSGDWIRLKDRFRPDEPIDSRELAHVLLGAQPLGDGN